MQPNRPVRRTAIRRLGVAIAVPCCLVLLSCTQPETETVEFAPFADAVLRYVQSDSIGIVKTYQPNDVKAESPDVTWFVDLLTGGVFRFAPGRADYRHMGALDEPPSEIERPVKLAVSRELGVFTYDLASRQVHLFSPDGKPLRAFDPGFVPSRFEIVHDPIGLVFGVIDARVEEDPRLVVIRTDARGTSPDTLLHSGTHGPESLWEAVATSSELSLDGGDSGLWARARAVPDTVFEVTDAPDARKRPLRPEDRSAEGILVDREHDILWVIRQGETEGELLYSAYEATQAGVVAADRGFLGERRTSGGFTPWDAIDGTIVGFTRSESGTYRLASYDMRVPADPR